MSVARILLKAPVFRPLVAPTRRLWARANDALLNISTVPRGRLVNGKEQAPNNADSARFNDSTAYESPDYWYIRRIRAMLFPQQHEDEVFMDIGCGKGRVLCLMAQMKLRRVIGIELSRELCRQAARNAARLRGRKTPIDVVCADAADADISSATTYFLFNPFGADTLSAVLCNIEKSLQEAPRSIRIVYYNPIHQRLCESSPWLLQYDDFSTQSGLPVTFWKSR